MSRYHFHKPRPKSSGLDYLAGAVRANAETKELRAAGVTPQMWAAYSAEILAESKARAEEACRTIDAGVCESCGAKPGRAHSDFCG